QGRGEAHPALRWMRGCHSGIAQSAILAQSKKVRGCDQHRTLPVRETSQRKSLRRLFQSVEFGAHRAALDNPGVTAQHLELRFVAFAPELDVKGMAMHPEIHHCEIG